MPDQGVHWSVRLGRDEVTPQRPICSRFGISRPFHGAKPCNNGLNRQKFIFRGWPRQKTLERREDRA